MLRDLKGHSVALAAENGAANVSICSGLAGEYGRAWAAHDVAAISALHTSDSVFHVHGVTEVAMGRPAVEAAVGALLALVPDLHFDTAVAYLGSDHIVTQYTMSGNAGGSAFSCSGADVIAVADGLVARKDTYLDLAAFERQGLAELVRRT